MRDRPLRDILRADPHDELPPIAAGAHEFLVLKRIVTVAAREEMLRRLARELPAAERAHKRELTDARKRFCRRIVPERELARDAVLAVFLTENPLVVRVDTRHHLDVSELHRPIHDLHRLVTERDRRRPKDLLVRPRNRRAAECTDIRRRLLVGIHRPAAAAALDRANLLRHEDHLPFDDRNWTCFLYSSTKDIVCDLS